MALLHELISLNSLYYSKLLDCRSLMKAKFDGCGNIPQYVELSYSRFTLILPSLMDECCCAVVQNCELLKSDYVHVLPLLFVIKSPVVMETSAWACNVWPHH